MRGNKCHLNTKQSLTNIKKRLYSKVLTENYAYFMEMGCGKSKVLIDNITWLYENKDIDTAIIIAPKGVYMNWKNSEIPTHLPDDVQKNVYVWKASANKTEKAILEEGVKTRDKLRILLVNVEAFATAKVIKIFRSIYT